MLTRLLARLRWRLSRRYRAARITAAVQEDRPHA